VAEVDLNNIIGNINVIF